MPAGVAVRQAADADEAGQIPGSIEDAILEADLGNPEIEGDERRGDVQTATAGLGEHGVEATEVARRQRTPGERVVLTAERLVAVEEVYRPRIDKPVAFDAGGAVPDDFAEAAAILGALPEDADAGAEIGLAVTA